VSEFQVRHLRKELPNQVFDHFDARWKLNSKKTEIAIIGDIHGCINELIALHRIIKTEYGESTQFVSTGDLVDRGTCSRSVVNFVRANDFMVARGNHDDKFRRWLRGNPVKVGSALRKTLDDFGYPHYPSEFKERGTIHQKSEVADLLQYFESLPTVLDFDMFQVVHAQPDESESLNMRGEKRDYHGVDVRYDWWREWTGKLTIFGHYWMPEPVIRVNGHISAIGVDTRCVAGGCLTALVLPDFDLVQVKSEGYFTLDPEHVILEKLEFKAWESGWQ